MLEGRGYKCRCICWKYVCTVRTDEDLVMLYTEWIIFKKKSNFIVTTSLHEIYQMVRTLFMYCWRLGALFLGPGFESL